MKNLLTILLLIAVTTFATGCEAIQSIRNSAGGSGIMLSKSGSFSGAMPEAAPPPSPRMMMAAAPAPAGGNSAMPSSDATAGRIFIRTADLTLEVKKLDPAAEKVRGIVEKLGGFISDTSASEDDTGVRSERITVRVPSEKLDEALAALRGVGHVRNDDVRSEDISEQYFDLETRLANARKLEARMVSLLEFKTTKLKDLLDTERELARVRQEIESMEGRKRNFDTRVALSTVSVTLTAPQGFGRGIFAPLKGLIQNALTAFTTSIAVLIVVLSAVIPWLIVLLIMGWGMLKLLRIWIHHKRAVKLRKQGVEPQA